MDMLNRFLCCVLAAVLSAISIHSASAEERNQHTAIVLFGATGDLATKYLWESIFNVYSDKAFVPSQNGGLDFDLQSNHSFSFMGVARSAQEKGIVRLNSILTENIQCDSTLRGSLSLFECEEMKKKFISSVDYFEMNDNSDSHSQFCNELQKMLLTIDKGKRINIVMYMAIPTTACVSVLENFKKMCSKHVAFLDIDIKWALEKPFGMDKMSANAFADKLQTSYEEHEIFHIDHYLQKSVVKSILQFRYLNEHLDKVWNKENIERVEIFLKESLDVKDRVSFYNPMGVLRDIHQNHLTELLILVAMELPVDIASSTEISQCKRDLIRLVESVKDDNILFGQYADYAKHVSLQMVNDTKTSDVPTFAAAVVKINSSRWKGVPFILVSGKQLERKESYIRIVFKERNVCVSGCNKGAGIGGREFESKPQVVFHIGHGDLSRPAILVSKSLGIHPVWPNNVIESDPANSKQLYKGNDVVYQTAVSKFFVGVVVKDLPAYHSVIMDLTNGVSSHFALTHQLLLSWHIWDSIVTSGNKKIRIYEQGDEHMVLNFKYNSENHLTFVNENVIGLHKEIGKEKYMLSSGDLNKESANENIQIASPAKFLGWKLVTSTSSILPSLLAKAISDMAKDEIKVKGSFHMALSGGSSIIPMLHSLASSFASLPWSSIHIWQVDERCVPHHDDQSNFGTLDRELFRHVNIPFANIHSMPVDIAGDLCDDSLGGAHLYTEAIKTHVTNSQLDMVILGLGADGHTASLFPESPSLHVDSDTFVTISNDGPDGSRRRMTLTLPVINLAKQVAVLVTGEHKRDILQRLEGSRSSDQYPILGVRPSNGTLTWYIDNLALTVS